MARLTNKETEEKETLKREEEKKKHDKYLADRQAAIDAAEAEELEKKQILVAQIVAIDNRMYNIVDQCLGDYDMPIGKTTEFYKRSFVKLGEKFPQFQVTVHAYCKNYTYHMTPMWPAAVTGNKTIYQLNEMLADRQKLCDMGASYFSDCDKIVGYFQGLIDSEAAVAEAETQLKRAEKILDRCMPGPWSHYR